MVCQYPTPEVWSRTRQKQTLSLVLSVPAMSAKSKSRDSIVAFNAKYAAYAHTLLAYSAFFSALIVGCWLHYNKIVQNSSYGYPDEWFPSVSAAIGDRYPERSIFQLFIACTACPRFVLVFLNYLILYDRNWTGSSYTMLASGLLRTFTCGGWVYITSTDDHDWHDIFMIGYIILTIPWTILVSMLSPNNSKVRAGRAYTALAFFAMLIPLIYFFIQHKVHVVPGAYSYYAYCEWALIVLDIAFDAWSALDFKVVDIVFLSDSLALRASTTPVPKLITKVPKILEETKDYEKLQKNHKEHAVSLSEFLVDIVNSFMFWTVVTSLLLCVWYFPLWHMGISGYEAAIAVMFAAPLIGALPPLQSVFSDYPQIARVMIVIFGIGANQFEDPASKLMSVTAGVGFGVISVATEYRSLVTRPARLTSYWTSFVLGLLSTSVAKFACHSNNPAWAIMKKENGGLNAYFFFLGIIAALLTKSQTFAQSSKELPSPGGSLILASMGLGAYFNLLKSFLSDSSTLVYWNWEGYPIHGPTPIGGGLLHFAAFISGMILSLKRSPAHLSSALYASLVIVSAYLLGEYTNWIGFFGGLGLTFYLASIGPTVSHSATGHNVTALFFLSFFFSVLLSLASVWTVAYAFVPGGPFLRELSNVVMYITVAMLLAGVANYLTRRYVPKVTRFSRKNSITLKYVARYATFVAAFCVGTAWFRIPSAPFRPFNEESRSFTAGIWCVHFGLDNDMWSSETRMRDLIRDAQVDIIGLLETDTQRLIGGNRDFTRKIAHDLGMYVDYGPGPNKHTWGAALLSKFPIISSSHHLLPSPVGELAPAIHATVEIYGELVDIVVFHSGQEEDAEDRRLQSLEVQRMMGSSRRPLVLLSYLVTEPLKDNYNTYVSEQSRVYDIDNTDWDRWCEYILFRDLKKVAYARISRSTITDTELQIAKFKLLTEEQKTYSTDFLYGNHYVPEYEVDPSLRMPALLRGAGVRGHFYHVFDEPRYFAQTPDQI